MIQLHGDMSNVLMVVNALWSVVILISGFSLRGFSKELLKRERNLNEYESYLERKATKLDKHKEALDNKELKLKFLK